MRAGCHLCDDAEATLEGLRPRYPHTLERVDINADAELLPRYGEQIPVLVIDGREYAAPLSPEVIERALKEAAKHTRNAPGAGPATATPWTAPNASAAGADRAHIQAWSASDDR
jgi:hypothetical protein